MSSIKHPSSRFEEDGSSHEPDNDWPHLWPVFDCCCDKNSIPDFVSRFREPDPYYNSSLSRNTRVEGAKAIECIKISYSLNFLSKHVWIAHHFHRSGSETREMIRMMTCSLPREKIERVIRKAAMFVKSSSLAFDGPYSGTSVGVAGKIPNLHPKVILCGMLECLEEECRTNTESYGNEIEKIERAINELRDPIMRRHEVDAGTATHGELGINSWKLSGIVTELIYIRQKLQFILSSIDPLDQTRGFPGSNEACSERTSGNAVGEVLGSRPEQLVSRGRWAEQLQGVHVKLSELRIKCQRNMMNIENLQKLVKANRGAVSSIVFQDISSKH
jgi:hypothetical protein